MIFIDLQNPFDMINHDILLKKLSIIDFSDHNVKCFPSHLSNCILTVKLKNYFSDVSGISCGVPQGSILGTLLFLIYVNDMKMAVKCNLFLYANDTCLVFQSKSVEDIEKQLNEDFGNIGDWFVDNKLSSHLREGKTRSILFASKRKIKKSQELKLYVTIFEYSNILECFTWVVYLRKQCLGN